ncbi:hypothetical protein [Pollutimonas harenae]|uniref:DUF4760 domain-containing protein n=1 Tax=Pollutimonas harenae TaxID=657015 RepID=A0A853GXB8_9BURK|nr:hypothetical protein [Pollutimonas harenae]NYT85396.1 hypothetical protein [Pollutimonas harenae]TEA70493.1 hypothetical protein ERD84_07315 [Pollutimonas harenae]
MDIALILLMVIAAWQVLRVRYQRAHIALLGQYLANLQLERHMETLTQGYTRAIHEKEEARQNQVLETFAQTEHAAAANIQSLAGAMQKENIQAASLCTLPFCLPYAEHFLPALTRDFRALLRIHAAGLRYVVDNESQLTAKDRAYHLSAELYLFQHSCHWFCKSRAVADARLTLRHKVQHQQVLDSVSAVTRSAYLHWMQDTNSRS